MFCWHKYEFVGAYWHECKIRGEVNSYIAFHLYKCKKCGKEYKNEIVKDSSIHHYATKIGNLERNGYKHINEYMNK